MNKIFKVKRNSAGNAVACSEIAKSHTTGKVIATALAVAITGLMSNGAMATSVAIEGVATGTEAVAVGEDSWATSTSGVANGHGAVATGTDIDRTTFAGLKDQHVAALNDFKNAQDAVTGANNLIDANKAAVDSLTKQIADLTAAQTANNDKINQKNNLEGQKNPLETALADKLAAENQAKSALDEVTAGGKNIYLNFTDVLNSLDWNKLTATQDSNANRNAISQDLKTKIETNFTDFAGKYNDQQYRDIVDGYINRQASYQGSKEGVYSWMVNGYSENIGDPLNNYLYLTNKDTTSVALDLSTSDADKMGELIKKTYHWHNYKYNNEKQKLDAGYIDLQGMLYYTAPTGFFTTLEPKAYQEDVKDKQSYINRMFLESGLVKQEELRPYIITEAARSSLAMVRLQNIGVTKYNIEINGKDLSELHQLWIAQNRSAMSSNFFNVKKVDGSYTMPVHEDFTPIILAKLQDYTVNPKRLLSSSDVKNFETFYNNIINYKNSIDWNDANSPVDLVDYKRQMDKATAYLDRVKQTVETYKAILAETQKANPDMSLVDNLTQKLITDKNLLAQAAGDRENFVIGLQPKTSEKGMEYINSVMPEVTAMIERANRDLKLYNDKDQLVVDVTSKAKDLQTQYDKAKAESDKIKDQIAAIDKQIADIGLTQDQTELDKLKADKEKELADAETRKQTLADELAAKEKELKDAQDALANSELADKGLRNIATGHNAFASGNDAIAIGTNTEAVKQNAIAMGTNTKVSGANSVAIGADNTVASSNVVALGTNINVATGFDNAVVLGSNSTPETASPTASMTVRGTTINFAGTNPTSTVSVGAEGAERQVVNVAAGRVSATSTDAINGSQLYGLAKVVDDLTITVADNSPKQVSRVTGGTGIVVDSVSTTQDNVTNVNYIVRVNDTIADKKFVADEIAKIKMPEMPDVSGFITHEESVSSTDDNIKVDSSTKNTSGGKEFKLTLAKDLKGIDSVGNDNSSIKFEAGTINVGGATISNVAAPTKDTDAANKKYVDDSRTVVTQGDGIKVTPAVNGARTTYNIALDDKTKQTLAQVETNADNIKKNADAIKANTDDIAKNKDDIKKNTDAIKVNADNINKGVVIQTEDGKVTKHALGSPISVIGGNNINTTTSDAGAVVVDLANDIKVGSLSINNSNVSIGATGINAGGLKITDVAPGAITPESTDAINGSQVYPVFMQVQENTKRIGDLNTRMGQMEQDMDAAAAGARAAIGIPQVTLPGKSMLGFGLGQYGKESAVAIGFNRLSDNGKSVIKGSVDANTQKKLGVSIGYGFSW